MADYFVHQSSFVDQHPGGLVAARILERRPGAGLVEGRAGFAPAEQLRLQLLEFGRCFLAEAELRLEHHDFAQV